MPQPRTSSTMSETLSPDALAHMQALIAESLMVPADSIGADDAIATLPNIDSLSFEMIIVAMETESGQTIDPLSLMPVKTVGDLADLLGQLSTAP